ncbi:MAG: hypothetical protein AAFP81_19575 [Pseudomonadota bacterium]
MPFDTTEIRKPFWEPQCWQPELGNCLLLKIKGEPYPFGSITYLPGFNPTYKCEAFVCDDMGRKQSLWIGEITGSLNDAELAVEAYLPENVGAAA